MVFCPGVEYPQVGFCKWEVSASVLLSPKFQLHDVIVPPFGGDVD